MAKPKVLGIISLVFLGASFFVVYKNQIAYENEIEAGKVEQTELKKQDDRLKLAEKQRDDTLEKNKVIEDEIAKLTAEETEQKRLVKQLQDEYKEKTDILADYERKAADLAADLEKMQGMAAKMKELVAEIQQLEKTIKDTQANLDALTAENDSLTKQVAHFTSQIEDMSSGRSLPTLKTHLKTIYSTWGFVTLPVGDADGVAINSTLNVVRDGKAVAKLLVSAVEMHTASASIIPGSMAEDVVLIVGDKVLPAQVKLAGDVDAPAKAPKTELPKAELPQAELPQAELPKAEL
jgi:cell division protein FtsB